MSDVKEIREQMASIATNARSKFDEITSETPAERAAEIEREFDAMMADHDKLSANLERAKKLGDATRAAEQFIEDRRPNFEGRASASGQEKEITYDDVFARMVIHGAGELSREERAILRTGYVAESRAQTTATGSSGGNVVPTKLAAELDKAMLAYGPMFDPNVVRVINTTSGEQINWPTIDDTSKVAELKAENAAVTDDGGNDLVFGTKPLNAYMYNTEIVRVPFTLLNQASIDIASLIVELFAERLGRTANTALTTGSGSSQPNGVVTASGLGVTAADDVTITADELIALQHSIDPAYRLSPKAAFMFNDTTLAFIRKLKDGQGNYLLQLGDFTKGVPSTILGKPFYINQAMDNCTTAAKKAVLFGDFGKYYVRKNGGYRMRRLDELFAANDQTGFIGFAEFDGECINTAAIKHLITAAA